MQSDRSFELIDNIKLPLSDPSFSSRVFTLVSRERKSNYSKDGDNLRRVAAEEYDDLSKRIDRSGIQDSPSVRNVLKTRRIANLLVNDKGELNLSLIPKLISLQTEYLYSLGPNRQYDALRQEHILKVLGQIRDRKDIQLLLRKIGKPFSNKNADQIIRETLVLPDNATITDAHAKRAVLSAWLCYLRQNVGSCFATAPAIIVHDEYPEQFLQDIEEILGTGRLKRTFSGIEYAVPLSPSWGAGDLKRPFVIPTQIDQDTPPVWQSPGLLAALEVIGLVDPEMDIKDKIETVKTIIIDLVQSKHGGHDVIFTSAENIIRQALLKKLKLTEKDLEDFESRPRDMLQSSLLIQIPKAGLGSGGKGESIANFTIILNKAYTAFKSLADNALLKAWEFTLASFSEFKAGFTRWNLYSSLGLGSNDAGGIGIRLYEILKRKVEHSNEKVHQMQNEYEMVYSQLKMLESRFRGASSEKDAQWMKMEYQSKLNEFHTLEEIRDRHHFKAKRYANLFQTLIDIYDTLFPQYFQEIYDADMHDVSAGPYDDSPAGFRLIYKHGRRNTSQWTAIHNPNEFIEHLANFFISTESELAGHPDMKGLEDDVSEIVTAIVSHIRSHEFLETAFHRMAEAHQTRPIKNPLENLDKIDKKPWAYTSGGTMDTLVSSYFKRDQKPTEVGRWVENPTELLVFFVDTLKQTPYKMTDEFVKNPQKSMLIHSPTHAFTLKPGMSPFKEAWQNEQFTYTSVRDFMIKPMEDFVDRQWLSEDMQLFLLEMLEKKVPDNFKHYFRRTFFNVHGNLNPTGFRDHLVMTIDRERGLQSRGIGVLTEEEIDSTLFSSLPLFSVEHIESKANAIVDRLNILEDAIKENVKAIIAQFNNMYNEKRYVTSGQLRDIVKSAIAVAMSKTSSSINFDKEILNAAIELNFAYPRPIIVGDTNWVRDHFAFLVNPGTGRFEFWRVDELGTVGYPMKEWSMWLNGSRRDRTWGIYTRTQEYSR